MTDSIPPQPKNRVFGCATIAILLLILVIGGGYLMFKDAFTTDPVKVAEIAARIAWGAVPPAGYEGKLGVDVSGVELAVFADADGHQIHVLRAPKGERDTGVPAGLRDPDDERQEIEELEPREVTIAGEECALQMFRRTTTEDGVRVVSVCGACELPTADGKLVTLLFLGDEKGLEEEGMRRFLESIDRR